MNPTSGADPWKVWAPEHGPRQVFFSILVKLIYNIESSKQQFSGKAVINFEWMLSQTEKQLWQKKTCGIQG